GRFHAPNLVLHLLGEPQRAVHAHRRIMWMRPLCRHIPLLDAHMQFAYGELRGEVLAPLGNRSYVKRRRLGSLTTSRCDHARRTRGDQRGNGANPTNRPPICFHGITSQHLLSSRHFQENSLPSNECTAYLQNRRAGRRNATRGNRNSATRIGPLPRRRPRRREARAESGRARRHLDTEYLRSRRASAVLFGHGGFDVAERVERAVPEAGAAACQDAKQEAVSGLVPELGWESDPRGNERFGKDPADDTANDNGQQMHAKDADVFLGSSLLRRQEV